MWSRVLALVAKVLPPGIELEFDGRFDAMFCYKSKNYALRDGDRVILKGSALRSRGIDRRADDANLFVAEEAVLAAVRIEAGDGDARRRDAHAAQAAIGDAQHIEDALRPHALAGALGLQFQRIQFTSDLLPADILGVSIYERDSGAFRFHPGPIR